MTSGDIGAFDGDGFDEAALCALTQLVAGDPDPNALLRIFEAFDATARRSVGAMHAARRSGDTASWGRAAHTLCSSAGMLGAVELFGACRAAERLALLRPPQDSVDVDRVFAGLDHALARVQASIVARFPDADLARDRDRSSR